MCDRLATVHSDSDQWDQLEGVMGKCSLSISVNRRSAGPMEGDNGKLQGVDQCPMSIFDHWDPLKGVTENFNVSINVSLRSTGLVERGNGKLECVNNCQSSINGTG